MCMCVGVWGGACVCGCAVVVVVVHGGGGGGGCVCVWGGGHMCARSSGVRSIVLTSRMASRVLNLMASLLIHHSCSQPTRPIQLIRIEIRICISRLIICVAKLPTCEIILDL